MSGLRGTIRVVPDKSLTHRGVLFAARSRGRTVLTRPNPGADCRATLRAAAALGARVLEDGAERWVVESDGALREPSDVLDLGNSGTGIRLLAGLVAGGPGLTVLTGDASLRSRPMSRIVDPLRSMGAEIQARDGGRAPLALVGAPLRGIVHRSPVASAQVKSCLLLAGLSLTEGEVEVHEPERSRDHTERLLAWYGAALRRGPNSVTLSAPTAPFTARSWTVPGDVSAAAFFLVAALLVPGSDVEIIDVGLNPTRTGALDVLRRMGAALTIETLVAEPEPVGTVGVRSSTLRGTVVRAEEMPRLVDEVPILAVAAAAAEGTTEFHGVGELRHKESDRVRTTLDLLGVLGVEAGEEGGVLTVRGRGPGARFDGGSVEAHGDHRLAMSALVAGLVTAAPLTVDSRAMIATSDPDFERTLASLGGER